MDMSQLESIYKFNKDAGLLQQGYDDYREACFLIEEALEGFDRLDRLADALKTSEDQFMEVTPKALSRVIVSLAQGKKHIPEVDRLDKQLDILVFGAGGIFKLGLSPEQLLRALGVVVKANSQKLKDIKLDTNGKVMKDKTTFIEPEEELQKILNERLPNGKN